MHIADIYSKFLTPKNLQYHMLRVASLSKIILESWRGLDINEIVTIQCCLLHDIAKPLTFDINKQAQFGMAANDIANLETLQKIIKEKYGLNEHEALINICKELKLNSKSLSLIKNMEWSNIPRLLIENNIESLITIYCDMRIGPKGILSLEERLTDLKLRTGKEESYADAYKVEQIIANNVKLNLHKITRDQINRNITSLLLYKLN